MGIRRAFGSLVIILISLAAGLMICEFGSRIFLDPIDYLSPSTERHDILGLVIPPHSGGHDEWGFRNKLVPSSVDIITLGDSHTYGNAARMTESWPHVLGQLLEKRVYNLGLGGYGPNQYYFLLGHRALGLRPRYIICGLYMGDDFDNARRITYGLDHWKSLRDPGYAGRMDDWDIWEQTPSLRWHKKFRTWLSSHSMIYRLVVHGLLNEIKGRLQVRHASKTSDLTPVLDLSERRILEAFHRPGDFLSGLDQEDAGVKEGMRITFELLSRMDEQCREREISFIVLVIPTKQLVFSHYLEHNRALPLSDITDRLIANEAKARESLFAYLEERNIRYVDTLPKLKQAVENRKVYASGLDTHPNKNGYRIIAETAAEYMKRTLSPVLSR